MATNGRSRRAFDYEYRDGEELVLRFRRPGWLDSLVPPAARQHWLAAQKEMLLAVRSLLDAAINRVEEREGRETQRRREIKVE